ncbi:MAG: YcxB family protein [Lachnospiraceae bacterium]|nr:YcxB family protein [Lachnospiraceae bacterium]MBQ6876352.1 YcxB family protein [Lachnospiraceae bacterium]
MSQVNMDDEVIEKTVEEKPDPLADLYGEKEIRKDLQIDKWDMYVFLMHHSYMSLSGVIGILLSLFCIGKAISDFAGGANEPTTGVFLFIGLWFLVINPIMMIGKAAMQVGTNPSLKKPITYIFTEKGLIQEQGEVKAGCRWEQVTKTVFMKRVWILYTGKLRGSILPVRQIGEQAKELETLIRRQTGKKR